MEHDRKLFRDDKAKAEEAKGEIRVNVVQNTGTEHDYILLTAIKNVIQKQLPKMPREYISRLVYDKRHKTLAILKDTAYVVGAITYRSFPERNFIEIVFCAVNSSEQVKGYGSYLMNHMKEQSKKEGIGYFLTYADNFAIGYFKKQGFTKEISLSKSMWSGYIKDYDGGTLMQCAIIMKVDYMQVYKMLHEQKIALMDRIRNKSGSFVVYKGIERFPIKVEDIPGLKEAGWNDSMRRKEGQTKRNRLVEFLRALLSDIQNHASSWPFMEPVNPNEVTDYLSVVTEPMDLSTMEEKLNRNEYRQLEEFSRDFNLIVDNCRLYNGINTPYYKCANVLEAYFNGRMKVKKFKE